MSLGRERYFFAGGNTPEGFTDFFRDIFAEDENEIYIIKGGPGTGKSKMMKSVAKAAILDGYDVEIIKCSGDPDSLDGVRIPELKKTILDGTAPHTMDMDFPGIRDRIINLGEFWNDERLRLHTREIANLNLQKSASYKRAYQYLKAAKVIQDNIEDLAQKALSKGKLNIFMRNLCDNFYRDIDISCKVGKVRRMFGTAITSKGSINTLDTLFRGLKVYAFRCDYGKTSSYVISQLQEDAIKHGFYVESLRCPFSPEYTEHLIIPQLSLAFTTYNKYHTAIDCDVFGEYLLDAYYNDIITEPYSKDLEYDVFRVQELLEKTYRYLERAQDYHKEIEDFYISSMDFGAVNQCTENIIENMLQR